MARRSSIPQNIRREVLTEAGYRCAVPTCRTILALDLHHILKVSEGGPNTADNLIALCPTCHALHHRKEIPQEALRVWKGMLVTLNRAFDKDAMDLLLFLSMDDIPQVYSSDGVLKFANLIAAGLVSSRFVGSVKASMLPLYVAASVGLCLTERGRLVVEAWKAGDKAALDRALAQGAGPSNE